MSHIHFVKIRSHWIENLFIWLQFICSTLEKKNNECIPRPNASVHCSYSHVRIHPIVASLRFVVFVHVSVFDWVEKQAEAKSDVRNDDTNKTECALQMKWRVCHINNKDMYVVLYLFTYIGRYRSSSPRPLTWLCRFQFVATCPMYRLLSSSIYPTNTVPFFFSICRSRRGKNTF